MAHGDYHCCACCDCKMEYAAWDSRTKEDICTECLRALHAAGVMVYDGAELCAWIKAHPDAARLTLSTVGFSECFYPNPVDEAMKNTPPAGEGGERG